MNLHRMDCTPILRAGEDAGDLDSATPEGVHSHIRQGREYQLTGKGNLSRADDEKVFTQRPCTF